MKVYILILLFIYLDGFIPSWKKYIALLVSDNPLETLAGMTELLVCLNDDIQRSFFCWLGGIILLIKCLTSNFVGDVLPAILILNNISKSGIYIYLSIYIIKIENCLAYACSYGIIPIILSFLRKGNIQIQDLIQILIIRITLIERYIPEIVANNGIATMINVLQNTESDAIKSSMCTALWNISEHFGIIMYVIILIDENKKLISDCGGIPYIENCAKIQSDGSYLVNSVGLLWNLACHPALTTCIKNTSVTQLLPSYLESSDEKLKVYSYGFAFVTNSILLSTIYY